MRRENLELRQQVGYWKSRHRDALGRVTALGQKVEQLEGEKRQLQADLFGRRSETRLRTIAPTTSTTLKTMPSDPGGIAANNRRTPGPSAAIIPDCRPARNSANCLRGAVSAPAAASRCSRAVIPKTPSRSRSRCGPTAGSFGGGDTSGPAPATVRSPSPPRRLPS